MRLVSLSELVWQNHLPTCGCSLASFYVVMKQTVGRAGRRWPIFLLPW
jgi:hypothetical protein